MVEGYLWKKGRKVPSMKRHYAVLKGTMLFFFSSQEDAHRSGQVPKRVLEVVDIRLMPATTMSDSSHPPHIVLNYVDADGSGTLQCRADSRETQQMWLEALKYALKEPDRLAQEEIDEAQKEVAKDAERHTHAVQEATEAVEAAGKQHREQVKVEVTLQQNRDTAVELHTQLETFRVLQGEALAKLQAEQQKLETARHQVHLEEKEEDDGLFEKRMNEVERWAAKVEIAASVEATHRRNLELLQCQIDKNSKEQQELVQRVQKCADESKRLRQVAAKSLEDAQRTEQRAKHLASWTDEKRVKRSSQLDPLAEGYLLCQHPVRTSMHRRYYVLTGNTLSWYTDQDAFLQKMEAPSGVLHVSQVAKWDGRVRVASPLRKLVVPFSNSSKTMSNEVHPNPFAVHTMEGKTLHCSAPLKKNQEDWISALHVSLTMPPLSPHRARAAKSRRDSFDLLASTPLSPKKQTKGQVNEERTTFLNSDDDSRDKQEQIAMELLDEGGSQVIVEGYLVGMNSLEETMKKKYYVLRALTLYVFNTHEEAMSVIKPDTYQEFGSTTYTICGVLNWNGHTTLMHYNHGLLLQTIENRSIYCSAPNMQEQDRWIHSVQQALLHHQHEVKRGIDSVERSIVAEEEEETATTSKRRYSYASARQLLVDKLQQYYADHEPLKLNDVPMLLSRYQGREQALIEHLDRLYGTSMGIDTSIQLILTVLGETASSPSTYEMETSALQSSDEVLVLQAATSEAQQPWKTSLEDAIDAGRIEPSALITESLPTDDNAEIPLMISPQATSFEEKLVKFYQQYNPNRVSYVETLLRDFGGREQHLLTALDAIYGTSVSSDDTFTTFTSQSSQCETTSIYREGYLEVKHPLLGSLFRQCFCVVDDTKLQCFDTSIAAENGDEALLSDVIVNLHPVTAKLAETIAFQLELQTNGVLLLRSDTAEILYDWIHTLRTRISSQLKEVNVESDLKDRDPETCSSLQQLRTRLVEFYETHNPSKIPHVDALLESFAQREDALLEQIDSVYQSQLSADPVYTSLCADLAATYAEKHEKNSLSAQVSTDEKILMEGYLMKRGHKIPSMHKRYCLLIGNELSYYPDSRHLTGGATTAPLGTFHVDFVGDWHGKTARRTFEYGMELKTRDGKRFFCAASSATEKQQWIEAFRRGIALTQSKHRRAEKEEENGTEKEHRREQLKQKLTEFYRVRNPAKLQDLDVILNCYADREFALLQAIDDVYGTCFSSDACFLALLPPLPSETSALATLKLEGYLKQMATHSSHSLWKRAQTMYVILDKWTLALFETREEAKSGGIDGGRNKTLLAVKDDEATSTRFAVETSDHELLRFEARDTKEKRLWLQVIRAALDTMFAQSILADDHLEGSSAVKIQGCLLLRLDFDCSQAEHWKRREIATSIEERSVTLENGNELVIQHSTSFENLDAEQARYRVLSTRAWTPSAHCWPVAASNRAPRFPFQIVTQEQFVLSCSATTDAERVKWLHHLRLGAEQASPLEMLEEQLLETKTPFSPARQSLVDERNTDEEIGEVSEQEYDIHAQGEAEEDFSMAEYAEFARHEAPLAAVEEEVVEVKENNVAITQHLQFDSCSDEEDDSEDSGFEDLALTLDTFKALEQDKAMNLPLETKPPPFVFRTAAMEGALTPWQTSTSPIRIPGSSKMKPVASVYAILVGCHLRCYESREAASQDASPSLDVELVACSSWETPTSSWFTASKDESLGFKVEVKGSRHGVCFSAPTLEAKDQWIQMMEYELQFVVAARSLSISERQFTQEVAEHLAHIAASTDAADNVTKMEGILRIRHHNVGSTWCRRFVVLEGSTMSICSMSDDESETSKDGSKDSVIVEQHELVGVETWRPMFTSSGSGCGNVKGTSFRVETCSGVYLECIAETVEDACRWKTALMAATMNQIVGNAEARDATLPFIAGARMEGYLKLKDRHQSARMKKIIKIKPWKTRYCVVMGTHWLVYATQSQALLTGKASTPVAVYEITDIGVSDEDEKGEGTEFALHVVPDKQFKCKARSKLERKRWVNAVEDELVIQAKTSEELEKSVREQEEKVAAREAVKTKLHLMKTDARRFSVMLNDVLEKVCEDSDDTDNDDSETNGDASDGDLVVPIRRAGPVSMDGSPESSPMRRNAGDSACFFDLRDSLKSTDTAQKSLFETFSNLCTSCFQCIAINSTSKKETRAITPLGLPGYSSTATFHSLYICDYYKDDR